MTLPSRRDALLSAAAACALPALSVRARAADATAPDKEIAQMLAARIDGQRRGSGAAAEIARRGHASVVTYGTANIGKTVPLDAHSIFQAASLTKVFTALLLADAVERGEVALNDPAALHLPYAMPSFEGRQITLLDLATHTSGLPLRPPSRADRDQNDPYAGYSENDFAADLRAVTLTQAPGTAYGYSNFAYGLLGAALARRAGTSYGALLEARVLRPLRLNETKLQPTPAMAARMVQGYDAQFAPARPWDFGALAPAGGLYSSMADLTTFLKLWSGGTGRLARAAHAMAQVSRPGQDGDTRMAIGWRLVQKNGRTILWSNGNGGGVRAFMAVAPQEAASVVAFANKTTAIGVDDIGMHALDPSSPVDVAPIPMRTAIAVPASVLDRYLGTYVYAPGDEMTVERDGEGIALLQGPLHIRLLAESERFFFVQDDNVTVEFAAPDGGSSKSFLFTQGGQQFRYLRK